MNQIVKYVCEELSGVEISCIMISGEPWFKGHEVAKVLGYKYASDAVKDHVPLKFKNKLTYLLKASKLGKTPNLEVSELNAPWICEAGLYKLVLKSKAKHAEIFQDWVCSEVLPSIRKTGSYNSEYFYNKSLATKDDVRQLARARGREDILHYDIVAHLGERYPDAIVQAGLGEHLTTKHAGLDAQLKGQTAGQPDITILRGLPNGFQDVLAIEFKNPNGRGHLDAHQIEYHKNLKDKCNVKTIVGHNYEDIIIEIHDHYKEVFVRAQTAALTDKPKPVNFATNENPQYWCKKQNLTVLYQECDKRGLPTNELFINSKREIVNILITFDKERA